MENKLHLKILKKIDWLTYLFNIIITLSPYCASAVLFPSNLAWTLATPKQSVCYCQYFFFSSVISRVHSQSVYSSSFNRRVSVNLICFHIQIHISISFDIYFLFLAFLSLSLSLFSDYFFFHHFILFCFYMLMIFDRIFIMIIIILYAFAGSFL